ncbi:MAG: hypothetical protein J5562_08090 [Clostridia bacterium]|nr:hypothetical protein [Clostridia bacterium]
MTEFGFEGVGDEQKRNSEIFKKAAVILAALLIAVCAVLFALKIKNKNTPEPSSAVTRATVTQRIEESETQPSAVPAETQTAEINGEYFEPGTYYWNINGNGEIVLENFENYPF